MWGRMEFKGQESILVLTLCKRWPGPRLLFLIQKGDSIRFVFRHGVNSTSGAHWTVEGPARASRRSRRGPGSGGSQENLAALATTLTGHILQPQELADLLPVPEARTP